MRSFVLVTLFAVLAVGAAAQIATNTTPPSHVRFVPHTYANRLAKHPTLPVLYLGLGCAPDSKNLVTFGLDAGGNVLTNTMQTFNDFFTDDGKNPTNQHYVLRPVVLPEQRLLYLAAAPASPHLYHYNSNAHHIAVVRLDERGQPANLLKAFRTTHTEASIVVMQYEPTARRLYLSFHTYWGWCATDEAGMPSREFYLVPTVPYNLWEYTFVPTWKRFIGVHQDAYLCSLRLTADGTRPEHTQALLGSPGPFGRFDVSAELGKVYIVSGPGHATLSIYSLNQQGGFTGVPRRLPLGETHFLRLDTKSRRLYSFHQNGIIRILPLDAGGYPSGSSEVFQVSCGAIRDVFLNEESGKLYVACTEPLKP